MKRDLRWAEANRLRIIFDFGTDALDRFLSLTQKGYVRRPKIVDRSGHESVRFVNPTPEDAILLKFARLVSLNKCLVLLIDSGFVQEQCIIQRAIEETNEDIVFLSINVTDSGESDKFEAFLQDFWKEDYQNPSDPVGSRIGRGYSRKGIRPFLHRVFGSPNPSMADDVSRAVYEMYSGFAHGAAPHIFELYDFDAEIFLTNGLRGTNRHLDYVMDASNSIYRSMLSMKGVAKSFGSQQLLDLANQMIDEFVSRVGIENLEKQANR